MANKIKFTVNSSNGIKQMNTNVYKIECEYIDPSTLEYITRNVILTSKNITIFTKECHTVTEDIKNLMNQFSTFEIDATIADRFEGYLVISEPKYDRYGELLQ